MRFTDTSTRRPARTAREHPPAQVDGRTDGPERRVGTLIINRETVDWIVQGEDEEVLTVDVPVDASGTLLKDVTGDLFT